MSKNLKAVKTRFRAFQLGQAGSSFSYCAAEHFTLIESMATDVNRQNVLNELKVCAKQGINTLHLTSWDNDHCSETGLAWVLENLKPKKIEYPGYPPHTEYAERCLNAIRDYRQQAAARNFAVGVQAIDPPYIDSLEKAKMPGYIDIFYHPKVLRDNSNDNSTIKFFRSGACNVLSLGDAVKNGMLASTPLK